MASTASSAMSSRLADSGGRKEKAAAIATKAAARSRTRPGLPVRSLRSMAVIGVSLMNDGLLWRQSREIHGNGPIRKRMERIGGHGDRRPEAASLLYADDR